MFEIEHMNNTFDYSLVDNETAEFLKEREYTINGIAEDARLKIGRELKKAQEKLANHHKGVFEKWYLSGGISKDDAYYYIDLVELSTAVDNRKMDNFLKQNKSLQRETLRKNTPKELQNKVLEGDITTHKEFQKLKRQLKQQDEEKAELQKQMEQARKSEEITRKQLEDEQNKEPEIIERYSEPEDYQSVKNLNEHLKEENSYYKKLANDFRNEVKEVQQQNYENLNEVNKETNSDLSYSVAIMLESVENFIKDNFDLIDKNKVLTLLNQTTKGIENYKGEL